MLLPPSSSLLAVVSRQRLSTVLSVLTRARDVILAQPGAYRCPCDLELRLAIFEVGAAAVGIGSGLADDVAVP